MIRLLLILMCLPALMGTTPGAALAAADERGAARLHDLMTGYLEHQQGLTDIEARGALQFDGDVVVEPLDTYYAVTLPHINILNEGGGKFEIGIISINAIPHDQPGRWKMSVSFPTTMTEYDPAGQKISQLTIGAQRFAGIWDEHVESFIKLDSSFRNIRMNREAENSVFSANEIQIRLDFNEDSNSLWNGPGYIRVIEPRANAAGAAIVSAAEIRTDFNLHDYNPQSIRTLREQALAMDETRDSGIAASPSHAAGLYALISEMIMKSGDGFTTHYAVKDFHLIKPTGEDIAIQSGFAGLDATGFSGGKVKLAARMGYNGYTMTPAPAGYADVQPRDASLGFVIDNLPLREIMDLGRNTMQGIAAQPQMAKMAGAGFLLKIPAILSQSSALMSIKDNTIANDLYRVTLNGNARADMSAVNSITAEARAEFSGLDKLLSKTQVLGSGQGEAAQGFRKLNGTLETLKGIGKVETRQTAEGASHFIHVFDFVMNQQGQVLVNGQDVFSLVMKGSVPGQELRPAQPAAP